MQNENIYKGAFKWYITYLQSEQKYTVARTTVTYRILCHCKIHARSGIILIITPKYLYSYRTRCSTRAKLNNYERQFLRSHRAHIALILCSSRAQVILFCVNIGGAHITLKSCWNCAQMRKKTLILGKLTLKRHECTVSICFYIQMSNHVIIQCVPQKCPSNGEQRSITEFLIKNDRHNTKS